MPLTPPSRPSHQPPAHMLQVRHSLCSAALLLYCSAALLTCISLPSPTSTSSLRPHLTSRALIPRGFWGRGWYRRGQNWSLQHPSITVKAPFPGLELWGGSGARWKGGRSWGGSHAIPLSAYWLLLREQRCLPIMLPHPWEEPLVCCSLSGRSTAPGFTTVTKAHGDCGFS